MGLSQRTKRKHVEKAMALLPAGATPLDYAAGGGGAMSPSRLRAFMIVGWIGLTLLLSMLLKTLVMVGALPMIAIYYAAAKPRGVLLTDHGLASLRRGFFNGRPDQVLGRDGLLCLDHRVGTDGSNTRLQIGEDQVWLSDRDLARFLDVAPPPAVAPAVPFSDRG
jgi:hypothetical protein